MNVLVIDYGMGNLGSVRRSLEECGAAVTVSGSPDELAQADLAVLPGVGAFADGMKHLESAGWPGALRRAALEEGMPLLGICLGMQLLASSGEEGGVCEGLGFVPGKVSLLDAKDPGERIPHIGWNEVRPSRASDLFAGIEPGSDFYFVHSYRFIPESEDHALASTPYCGGFVSAVARENILGVQFHPEKSSKAGLRLLKNFLMTKRSCRVEPC